MLMRSCALVLALAADVGVALKPAEAVPAFAGQSDGQCNVCVCPTRPPRLDSFGEQFHLMVDFSRIRGYFDSGSPSGFGKEAFFHGQPGRHPRPVGRADSWRWAA